MLFHHVGLISFLACFASFGHAVAQGKPQEATRQEIEALNAAMVSAFRKDPGTVAAFYIDGAAILGAGERHQGRAAIDAYWKGATMFKDWTLEALETGGPADAPWQYGRSVLIGQGGKRMETYFIGLLRRQASGELRFAVDVFTRERQETGSEDARRITGQWLDAVQRGDSAALNTILDDQFVIVSSTSRNKAQEIADLVPKAGVALPYFRSVDTQTHAFGAIAVTSGVLQWEFNGRSIERNYSSIAIKRGAEWKVLAQHITPRR